MSRYAALPRRDWRPTAARYQAPLTAALQNATVEQLCTALANQGFETSLRFIGR